MGCTSGAMKLILNALNCLLVITGILLIVLGALVFKSAPPTYVYFLFIVGGVNLCAALLGCCGICHEHICMTTTYSLIILASLIAQIVSKVYSFDYIDSIKKYARESVEKSWLQELNKPGAMDSTQQTYGCCGKIGPTDYALIPRAIPTSCYPDMKIDNTKIFTSGCIHAAENKFVELFRYSSHGEWFTLAITAIMFVFAVYLVIRFRGKQRHYNY